MRLHPPIGGALSCSSLICCSLNYAPDNLNAYEHSTVCDLCRALPAWQAIIALVMAGYIQLALLGASILFSGFMFGLIFNHSVGTASDRQVKEVIALVLNTCFLSSAWTNSRVRQRLILDSRMRCLCDMRSCCTDACNL